MERRRRMVYRIPGADARDADAYVRQHSYTCIYYCYYPRHASENRKGRTTPSQTSAGVLRARYLSAFLFALSPSTYPCPALLDSYTSSFSHIRQSNLCSLFIFQHILISRFLSHCIHGEDFVSKNYYV